MNIELMNLLLQPQFFKILLWTLICFVTQEEIHISFRMKCDLPQKYISFSSVVMSGDV
jgi:hypothetical protein